VNHGFDLPLFTEPLPLLLTADNDVSSALKLYAKKVDSSVDDIYA
jgi:hypothetical protein